MGLGRMSNMKRQRARAWNIRRRTAIRQDNWIGVGLAVLWGGVGLFGCEKGGGLLIAIGAFILIITLATWRNPKPQETKCRPRP